MRNKKEKKRKSQSYVKCKGHRSDNMLGCSLTVALKLALFKPAADRILEYFSFHRK